MRKITTVGILWTRGMITENNIFSVGRGTLMDDCEVFWTASSFFLDFLFH